MCIYQYSGNTNNITNVQYTPRLGGLCDWHMSSTALMYSITTRHSALNYPPGCKVKHSNSSPLTEFSLYFSKINFIRHLISHKRSVTKFKGQVKTAINEPVSCKRCLTDYINTRGFGCGGNYGLCLMTYGFKYAWSSGSQQKMPVAKHAGFLKDQSSNVAASSPERKLFITERVNQCFRKHCKQKQAVH